MNTKPLATFTQPDNFWKGSKTDPAEARKKSERRGSLRNQIARATDLNLHSGGTLGDLAGAPLVCLPSSIPATTLRELPMDQATFDETLGPEFSLIPDNANQQSTGLISKLTAGGSPLAPFFMRSCCIVGRVDPAAWALVGGAVTTPPVGVGATPPVRIPRVVPVGGVPDDAGALPSVFEYNHEALQGFVDFLSSFQFQYLLQGRFLMVNERAIDVGVIDSQWNYKGFGTALSDPGLLIQQGNKHFIEQGSSRIFQQPNVSGTTQTSEPLEPALVETQYATPYAPGVFGVCYPVKPHILFPGQQYQFLFTRLNENFYYNRMQARWTAQAGLQKPSDRYADSRPADVDGPAIFSGHVAFKYGVLQFGVILRGAEVLPEECMQWLLMFGQPYYSVLAQDRTVWAQVDALARECGLAGIPRPLGLPGKDPRWAKTNAIRALFSETRTADGALAGFDVSDQKIGRQELRAAILELAGEVGAKADEFMGLGPLERSR